MKITVLIVVLVLILGGAYYFTQAPKSEEATSTSTEFVLRVSGKALVDGPEVMTVKKGTMVTIRVTADEAEEFHVHGYDRSVDLEPNVEASLTFLADTAGRFHTELEGSKTEIATLEVLP